MTTPLSTDNETYFSVFDLPFSFTLSLAQLNTAYTALIAEHHPDNFADDEQHTMQALEFTAYLNTAYKTLKHPVERGAYMLSLHNINAFDEYDTQMQPAFLIEQIELQEQLESLSDESDLEDYLASVKTKIISHMGNIHESYEAEQFEIMRNLVRELKFYIQLQTLAEEKLESFL